MAVPTWITKAGSLGIATMLEPFATVLQVATGNARAYFTVISGALPPGLSLGANGNIQGYPVGKLGGVPLAVNEDITFRFVIRCTNERFEIADRTFSITVTGEVAPVAKPATYVYNSLGTFADGTYVDIDVSGSDANPDDVITYTVVDGALPLGLSVNSLGHITGYVEPSVFTLESAKFDTDNWDGAGWDLGTLAAIRDFHFDLSISDGKISVVTLYSITVVRSNLATGDTTAIDAASALSTETLPQHVPVLVNRNTDIGTVLDQNYFFHQFIAENFDTDAIGFEVLPIIRNPTVIGSAVNPVITSGKVMAFNKHVSDTIEGTGQLTYSLSTTYTYTTSLGVLVGGILKTPVTDFQITGDQLTFVSAPSGSVIEVIQGVVYIYGVTATLGSVTGGSGYTTGTYYNVQLTRVSGPTTADYPRVDITVSAGVVTTVTLVNPGSAFAAVGTVLSCAASYIGGTGSGWSVSVASLVTQTVTDVAANINAAAAVDRSMTNVSAEVHNGCILIYTTDSKLTIEDLVGSTRTLLGIEIYLYIRNVNDPDVTDPVLDLTQDVSHILPVGLEINPNTGWLHGYLEPLLVGSETHTFYLRVFKKTTEPSLVITPVDYVTTYPFSIINNRTAGDLRNLGLDDAEASFVDKTIVFGQQEGFPPFSAPRRYSGLAVLPASQLGNVSASANKLSFTATSAVLLRGSSITITRAVQTVAITGNLSIGGTAISAIGNGGSQIYYVGAPSLTTTGCSLYSTELAALQSWSGSTALTITGSSVTGAVFAVTPNIWYYTDPNNIEADGWFNESNQVIDGWTQSQANPTLVNKRAGVWKFTQSGPDLVLEFVQPVQQGTVVLADRYTGRLDRNAFTYRSAKLLYEAGSAFTAPQTVPEYITNGLINPYSKLWKQRITVDSSSNYLLNWQTASELGVTVSGLPCEKSVTANNQAGGSVQFQLVPYNTQTVVGKFTDATLIAVQDVTNLVVGMRVKSADITLITDTPVILSINTNNNQIKLSTAQTLPSNTVLHFLGNELPRGLTLTSNGEIQGRASHQHWSMDDHTTFDAQTTTFDRNYILNIQAVTYLNDPVHRSISSTRSFRLTIQDYKDHPSSNLLLEFLMPAANRQAISNVLYNQNIVPDEYLYRGDDAWWGRQLTPRMLVAYGLDTTADANVINAVAVYHHRKHYHFTGLKWAEFVDSAGVVKYEVIYLTPEDEFTISSGVQFSGDIDVRGRSLPINLDSTEFTVDTDQLASSEDYLLTLTPASLPNMQARIRSILGNSNRRFLPGWMTCVQPDDRTLNYTQAVPLVYLKPGTGKLALYKMQQALNVTLLSGLVDRYVWDNGLALNWNQDTQKYYTDAITTFDQLITGPQFTMVGDVDLALDIPFSQIQGARSADLRRTGVLDGYRGSLNGLRVVFFRQEQYENITDFITVGSADHSTYAIDGWAGLLSKFDNNYDVNFETFQVITGYTQLPLLPAAAFDINTTYFAGALVVYLSVTYMCIHTAAGAWNPDYWVTISSNTVNQRAGIWQINEDYNGVLSMEFVQTVPYTATTPFSSLRVRLGVRHGGSVISLMPAITGFTVPGYVDRSSLTQQGNKTIFDTDITQFFDSNTDEFIKPDDGAKYIVFKKLNFIDRGTVDV